MSISSNCVEVPCRAQQPADTADPKLLIAARCDGTGDIWLSGAPGVAWLAHASTGTGANDARGSRAKPLCQSLAFSSTSRVELTRLGDHVASMNHDMMPLTRWCQLVVQNHRHVVQRNREAGGKVTR